LLPDPFRECPEHIRLLALYREAVKKLTESSAAVAAAAGSYEADIFSRSWTVSQEAWHDCTHRRRELHEHILKHRC
jgi:hypothetical protein